MNNVCIATVVEDEVVVRCLEENVQHLTNLFIQMRIREVNQLCRKSDILFSKIALKDILKVCQFLESCLAIIICTRFSSLHDCHYWVDPVKNGKALNGLRERNKRKVKRTAIAVKRQESKKARLLFGGCAE